MKRQGDEWTKRILNERSRITLEIEIVKILNMVFGKKVLRRLKFKDVLRWVGVKTRFEGDIVVT